MPAAYAHKGFADSPAFEGRSSDLPQSNYFCMALRDASAFRVCYSFPAYA
jgi:hypothetical protein